MDYLKCIEKEELEELRLSVLGPDAYVESTEFCVQKLSSEVQVSFIKKLLTINETSRPGWLRFIQRYILYHPISDDAINVLVENINSSVSFNLLIKIINSQGYSEAQGKSLCILMLHCDDLGTVLALFQLICMRGGGFSMAIYNLLNNLDKRMLKSGHINMEFFADNYLQSTGQSLHLFKLD